MDSPLFQQPRHRRRGRHRVHPEVRHGAVRADAEDAEVEEVRGGHGGARAATDDATGEPEMLWEEGCRYRMRYL